MLINLRSFQEKILRKIFFIRNFLSNNFFVKKLDYDKFDLKIYIDSALEYFVRSKSCTKEPETIKWIENCGKCGGVFYDIGANVGAYTLIAAKNNLKAISFEPSYTNFHQLNRNIKLNNLEKFITPINAALSNNTKIATFNFLEELTGTSKCYFNETGHFHLNSPIIFTRKITVFSLDNFIENIKAPIPNFIKIDVDGAEYDVICGAIKTLKNNELKSIQIEIDHKIDTWLNIIEIITSSGFINISKIDFKNKISNYIFGRE